MIPGQIEDGSTVLASRQLRIDIPAAKMNAVHNLKSFMAGH